MTHYLFEQFTAIRLHTAAAYSHDGRHIAFIANTSGQYNLWIVPSGGGAARQLTAFEDQAVRGLAWSHNDSQIAFLADSNGDEFYQVYLVNPRGSWPRRVTDKLDAQYDLAGWTPDDKCLIYSGNDREPSEVDPLIHNLQTGEIRHQVRSSTLATSDEKVGGRPRRRLRHAREHSPAETGGFSGHACGIPLRYVLKALTPPWKLVSLLMRFRFYVASFMPQPAI